MEKIKNLIVLDSMVTFPLEEMKNHAIGVQVVFDLRGQDLAKGKSEEWMRDALKRTVFNQIPEVMAEYIAISLAISTEDGEKPNHLEEKLLEHLKELKKISQSALDEAIKKQKNVRDQ